MSVKETLHYSRWISMKSRCYNPKSKPYHDYGGRGIKVCDEWINDFKAYRDYIISLPNYNKDKLGQTGLTIDRIDNNDNYRPGNLRWIYRAEQNRNKRILYNKKDRKQLPKHASIKRGCGHWKAFVTINNEKIKLGNFSLKSEAHKVCCDYIYENT